MIKNQLQNDLKKVLDELGLNSGDTVLSIPKNSDHGDYSSNIALQQSNQKSANSKQNPKDIASQILQKLGDLEYLEKAEIEGPGFINFFIKKEFLSKDLTEILKQQENYGSSLKNKGKKARVEFVSANPTGPMHFGNGRGGPIGDSIASVLKFSGYEVLREYIDNDCGNQVLELGKSIAARAGFIDIPEEQLTYKGEYINELVTEVKGKIGDLKGLSEAEIIKNAGEIGVDILFLEAIKDCKAMGIEYDLVVHESELQKQVPPILEDLKKKGLVKEYDGAVWFAPNDDYLKDREAVIIKSDGSYTYFAADITYHKQKFESGADLVIDIFGSNTLGHVPKLQALVSALGFDPKQLKVIIYQYVRFRRGNEFVKMSKRAGNFVTVREVLEEVGKDSLRFSLLLNSPTTHIDFDLELYKQQSAKNPVFYVQYAHARMSSILSKSGEISTDADFNLLIHLSELNLIKHLSSFPDLVDEISQNLQIQGLTGYAIGLADLFHKFYESCPVLNAQTEQLKDARLLLVKASKITLGNTLGLLGVSAPEKM